MYSKHASTFLPRLASWAEAAEGSQLNDLTILQFKDVGACMMALPEKLSCEPVHRLKYTKLSCCAWYRHAIA